MSCECGFRPGGLDEGSPTPQSLRRDRSGWSHKVGGFGCAVVCEGDMAVHCLEWVYKKIRPVGYGLSWFSDRFAIQR
jgi:hypothetical protein